MPTPPTILLIGAGGQLGWELLKVVPTVGRGTAIGRPRLDLADTASIDEAIERTMPDLIINAAADTNPVTAERDPTNAHVVNAIAAGCIAERARAIGAGLIHFSCAEVFDGESSRPYRPADGTSPVNAFGRTIVEAEQRVLNSGASAIVFRLGWLISRRGANLMTHLLTAADDGASIRAAIDRHGSPTWTRSIADIVVHVIRSTLAGPPGAHHFDGHEGLFHLAALGDASLYDLAIEVFSASTNGSPSNVVGLAADDRAEVAAPRRPRYTVLDSTRTADIFDLVLPTWQEDVNRCINDRFGPEEDMIFMGLAG